VKIAYRECRPDDAPAIAELHVQCWREAYGGMVPQSILDAANVGERAENWRKTFVERTHFTLAAFDAADAVGFIHAGQSKENLFEGMDGHVGALYVLMSHYRQGIGTALLRRAAGWWRNRGGRSLALGVLAENLPARRFYEALGARLVRTGTFTWHGFEIPDAIYAFDDLAAVAGRDGSPPLQ
jgi:ribosomal protein S18 acetylase RimI-like enzyme